MITLGKFTFTAPLVVLAPMAGISDLPFRRLCQQQGCHFTVAEMVNAHPELLNSAQSQTRMQFDDNPAFPKIVQLAGGDPLFMAEAAQLMQARGADVIDINMGCPAKKVGQQNAGSALLSDLPMVEKILAATVKAVSIPVTLKTRIGFDANNINLLTVGAIAADCGIAAISVHGRHRAQRFKGQAQYREIAALKAQNRLPVIVNGDICSSEQARQLIQDYGFDGVMIGRAAQGNPWLFAEIRRQVDPKWQAPPHHPYQDIQTHIRDLHRLYPSHISALIARKHLHWYFVHHPHYLQQREAINHSRDQDSQSAIIRAFETYDSAGCEKSTRQ